MAKSHAKADKLSNDFLVVCYNFIDEHHQYLSENQKIRICNILLKRFSSDIDQYYKKKNKAKNGSEIKMLVSQWPQVILYRELSKAES